MMKPTYSMDDLQWHTLIQDISQQFTDLTLKRGFQYFKQERVHQLTISDHTRIEAVVEGAKSYKVTLLLDALSGSYCTCPIATNCKHMVAVLLNYAEMQERSVHAIVNAHSTAAFKTVVNPSSPVASKRTSAAFAKLKDQASQIPNLAISEWHDLFQICTASLDMRIPNTQYAKDALTSIYAIKPQLAPAMEQLFELHAHLFVLEQLIKPMHPQGYSSNLHMGYNTQVATDDIQAEIKRILTNKFGITAEPEHWHHLSETITYLRGRMLTKSQPIKYFTNTYYLLWLSWIHPNLHDTKMYLEELQLLQSAEAELGTGLSRTPWLLAQSWMHFYLSDDEQAKERLQAVDHSFNISSELLYPFLEYLYKTEEWSRLMEWLMEIGPLLVRYRNNNLTSYMVYWEETTQHLPEAEKAMWDTLVHMLPSSKKIYEETLLTHHQWQQWMDFQLSLGKEPMDFRVSVLQPIDKHAPELLLPFYHQAVERYVLLKNRTSYKSAVKLLKRLSKLYKKMKKEERWELFITTFSSRYSRLRALQEELRKGKLIP